MAETGTAPLGLPLPLTGETRLYMIIGDPIAQVGSPGLVNASFRRRGVPAVLFPAHVRPEGLKAFLAGLRPLENLDGIVLTIPHKQTAMDVVDTITPRAQAIGAVNVIRPEADGTWTGDNFDGEGCVRGLTDAGHSIAGKSALLVGCGGAGSAIAHAFADAGVSRLRLADLDESRLARVAGDLARAHPALALETGPPDPSGFVVVANATPLGMREGDPLPVDPDRLTPGTLVVDVITKPAMSPLLTAAAAKGCTTQQGPAMLIGQVEAFIDFFLGKPAG
ncbi:shikimate dehydrogenase [Acuticoccus sp. M5D2P5]|uniref:shikimate dehydrogenase family protein n=1 Tax=Acuticoccus kalidii TaxID=2910977 RepID=UPI001F28A9FE|nr:shikimate dehydrogenase [Acuticoccus kalidii]MCF3935216.1 shikimate dehydrogenase [Acuticoccus kalidii]